MHQQAPEGLERVWQWFLELNRTRDPGRRLRWTEIEAWARLHERVPLLPVELAAIKAFDDAYMANLEGRNGDR